MTAQESFREILDLFYQRLARDPQARAAMRRVERQTATFTDTAQLSERASVLLGEVFGEHVLDVPEELRESVCTALLRERYDTMNGILADVQEAADEALGLSLDAAHAPFPAERVQTVAHSLIDPGVTAATIQRRANKPVATVARSFHDDFIETNAKKRSDLGLRCHITRETDGKCCPWCDGLAGRYVYGRHPSDIFRRHDNCGCTVTYEEGRARQDVWTKRSWERVDPEEVAAAAPEPIVFSREDAAAMEESLLSGLTLAGERDIMDVEDTASIHVPPAANSQEELERKTTQYNEMLDGYTTKKSKWSGKVSLVSFADLPSAYGKKEWDCSIVIRDDTGDKTVIHELLHARSCSYFASSEFKKCRAIEESSVELFAQEICNKQGILYNESYPIYVGYLRDINRIASIEENDFVFAQKLFEVNMPERYTWLCQRVTERLKHDHVGGLGRLTIASYLDVLGGDGLA